MHSLLRDRWFQSAILVLGLVISEISCSADVKIVQTPEAVFTLNDFSGFPSFSADVNNLPGTPVLIASGLSLQSVPQPGNAFLDAAFNRFPAGHAIEYSGPASKWIGNNIIVRFTRNDELQVIFSYDYLAQASSAAASGIRLQGQHVFTLVRSVEFVADGEWHRVTHRFNLVDDAALLDNGPPLEVGIGPDFSNFPGLRIDNIQIVLGP